MSVAALQPITTAAMREAAQLWADARNAGLPTASDAALNGDVILAAQARTIGGPDPVVIATTIVSHLARYTPSELWYEI